jgi:2-polyprenyl-6-methoxyphenol hydroxylase-like FAD-dependent oxidoreductase
MVSARSVIIAGAGIGGLTAALAVARRGFRVTVFDQAQRLDEIGAGVQLSPNASRILISLELAEQLRPHVVVPEELRVTEAATGRLLARAPLGVAAAQRYGAPYWVIHRGDLQAVLVEAVRREPKIELHLGTRVEAFATDRDDVVVFARTSAGRSEHRGLALIGADGLWSTIRENLGHPDQPRFAGHTAWRALVPAATVAAELREPVLNLWLGAGAHLVHYPVRGGNLLNVVAIARDAWREPGWSAPAGRKDVLARYPADAWPSSVRAILEAPRQWQKWALCDRAPLSRWGKGRATLLGDAAHPMLPYLAQGAAMAIEDAALLAQRLGDSSDDPQAALRAYEHQRARRTARVQRAARRNGTLFHLAGAPAFLRTLALLAIGGKRLTTRYDWLYGWKAG